ncbi:MAG: DUF4347 domain-containing protein [Candidatus Thiodiazotropha sp. (ex Monitilora ramsayi)]|nr:DUF4347 domain-containing protein [Candidatus Thiodiazotropha sp. (ex Monitilora ramsayi)]
MSRDRPKKPNALIFEELEPRLLLSADIAGIAIDPAPDGTGDPVDDDDLLSLGQSLLNEPIPVDSQEAETGRNELVIIDPLTPDYQSLVDDLIDREGSDINFEIILLDSVDNGIEQMGHILDQYRDLDALHLISHGSEGEVRLAGATLDLSALNDSLEQIGGWSNAFAAEGDLLIYGCNLASTAEGELFINRLAQLTGVDVAASDDLTGSVSQGGDWDLEYQVGTLETGIAFSGQLQSSWSGMLDITTGLVGYYDFEEGSGITAIDSSATGNNGTLIGSPVYTAGQVGSHALSFNGDFDRVEAPDSLATNFGTGDFAVSFWFNSTYSGGTARLVGDMDGGDGYVFYTTGTGDVTFGVVSGIDSVALVSGGLFDGSWHHVVGMVNGADWSLYVDGTLADSINNGFIGNIDNSNTLRIGASSASHNEYDGLIDDVRLYDRVLTTTDINELFALAEDPPSITGASLTLSEGQTVTLDGANFSISDPDSSSFTYSLSGVAGGYFQLSTNPGVSITSFTSANLTGGVVQFVDNDDETAPAFSVTVNDGTSDSNTRVATISYTPVNDAPDVINLDGDVLNYTEGDGVVLIEQGGDVVISDPDSSNFAGGSLTVEVDSGLQAAEDKFSIVNQGTGAGQIGLNVSDVTYSGVVIGSVSGGTGIDPLTVTLNSNATSAAVTALIRNISYENSNIDNPTTGLRSIVVDISDGDGGASVTQNLNLNVSSVNDAPALNSASLTVSEGQTVTLSGANFGITDPDDSAFTYTVSGATGGYFQLSSAPGTPITIFTSADLTGSLVQFVDNGDETAPAFSVKVNDGTSDSNTLAASITFTNSNDAPVVGSASLTISESQTVTLSGANFDVTDPDSSSFTYTVSGVTGGYFQLSTNPGVSITSFTSANLTGGLVQFVDDGNEVAPTFSVTANDGGSDSNTLAASITYTSVNDAPVVDLNGSDGLGVDFAVSFTEGAGAVNVVDTDATVSDVDSVAYENLSINLTGFLDGGSEQIVIAGYTFTYGTADTATRTVGSTSFVIDFDGSGFNVMLDGLGWMPEVDLQTLLRGVTYENTSLDPIAGDRTINIFAQDSSLLVGSIATSTITVNPQNDAPTATNNANSVLEDGFVSGNVITDDSGSGVDSDPEGDSLQVTQVEGGAYTPGLPITLASGAQVTFQSNGSYTYNTNGQFDGLGAGSSVDDSFTYQVSDGNGGFDTATVTITINGSNNTPSITSAGLTLNEGQTVTLSDANFAITDADDIAFTYTVSGISGGYFQLSSAPGTPVTTFTSANLTGGLVQFVDNGDETTPAFSVTVNDGDADSNTLAATVIYTSANDVPVLNSADMTVTEGQTVTLTGANFGITDPDSSSFTYTMSGVTGGYFQSSTNPGVSITSFTSANLTGGLVQFVDNGDETAPVFSVTVNDGATDSNTLAATISYTSSNDVPVLDSASLTVGEGQTVTLSGASFGITDPDDTVFSYTLSGVTGGYFQLNTNPGVSITSFSSAELSSSLVQFVDNGDETAPAFSVTVNDGEADSNTLAATVIYTSANDVPVLDSASLSVTEGQTVTLSGANFGITDSDDTAFTYTVSSVVGGYFQLSTNAGVSITTFTSVQLSANEVQFVDNGDETAPAFSVTVNDGEADSNTLAATVIYTSANDVPVLDSASLSVTEGQTVTLSGANFSITDLDDTAFTYTLSGVTGGYFQLNTNPGVSVTSFTSANLTGGLVQFVDNGDETAPAFSVTVNDGVSNSNTLAAIVSFTTIDEAPIANNDSVDVDEGGSVLINVASNDADPENALDLTSIAVVGLPANGVLVNNGDGTFVYTHNGSETLSDLFTYTIKDDSGATSNVAVVDLTIHPVNDVPVITSHAGSQTVTSFIDENLNVVAGVSADDAEGDGLTFSISGGADFGLFAIDHLTGLLSFSSAPNAESPLDSDRNNSYSVEVMVSDGNGGTAIQAFDITVRDVDEFDVGLLMDMQSNPDQVTTIHTTGSEVGVTVWASDPDISNNDIVYSLVDDGGGHFVIDNTTGEISLAQPFVTSERYQSEVIVRATSSDGSISQRSFLIDVLPVDEPVVELPPPTLDEIMVDLLPEDSSSQIAIDTHAWAEVSDSTDLSASGSSDEEATADEVIEGSGVVVSIETYEQTMSFADRLSRSLVGVFDRTNNHSVVFRYFDLTSEPLDIDALPKLSTIAADNSIAVPKTVWTLLDAMSLEISQHQAEVDENSEMVFKGVTVGAVGLTAGYVAWLLRAGLLSASLLSFSPLWRQVDPLPVLSASAKKRTDNESESPVEDAQEKRISKLFDNKSKSHQGRYAG